MKLLVFICIFFMGALIQLGYSQGNPISASSLKELKKRPLLVSLIPKYENPENSEEIAKMNKIIEKFNETLKQSLEKYWFEGTEFVYKTDEEINKIRESGTVKYGVFYLSTLNRAYKATEGAKVDFYPENEIRILNYAKIETKNNAKKYSFYMTDLGKNTSIVPFENDIILSVKLMMLHLKEIERLGKKLYSLQTYCKDQAKLHCSEIGNRMLYINKKIAGKMTLTGNFKPLTKKDYKVALKADNVEVISKEDIAKKIINEEESLVGIPIPEFIGVGNGIARKLYYRVFVDAKSGQVFSYAGSTSVDNSEYFSTADMKAIAKCR